MEYLYLILLIGIILENTYQLFKMYDNGVHSSSRGKILIDTSVLIDGRIIPIVNSNFISDTLMIPQSVMGELQKMADGQDYEKRIRARYGLDVISELKAVHGVKVKIIQDGLNAAEGVDERLIKLAKKHRARICTIDYNLNKVAKADNVTVLNVNDLALSLRMNFIPGDKVSVKLMDKGSEYGQAIGYLSDGTLIIVDNAQKSIGRTVTVKIKRSLQTSAGRMAFADIEQNNLKRRTHGNNINRQKNR